jgi:hypothetical protein
MRILRRTLLTAALLALAASTAGAQQPPPQPAPPSWPDLSGTWKGTWGGAPASLVLFKKSEQAFVSQALSGSSNFGYAMVGQTDAEVKGVLSTDGRAGPVSISVAGRMGMVNNRLNLVLTGQPGWSMNDYQELVFTSVTPERLEGSGSSSVQWGPNGPVDLKREAR